jgi:hypothetical protein
MLLSNFNVKLKKKNWGGGDFFKGGSGVLPQALYVSKNNNNYNSNKKVDHSSTSTINTKLMTWTCTATYSTKQKPVKLS